ncbi:MAG: hypothetical protein Q9165_001436 [Trypethelium subeluteriae]
MADSPFGENALGSVATSLPTDSEQRIPPVALPETCDSSELAVGSTFDRPATGLHNNIVLEVEDGTRNGPTAAQKGKQVMIPSDVSRKRPLKLLDLPVDILKEIIKEVTHTNDLTSLALCHSALHNLAIPHIYSRFDIVWPDETSHSEPRTGVDALTYGLSTLVMAEDVFGEAAWQRTGNLVPKKRRRGNRYAQYTRKFSLGNGPRLWVQEYLISKEGGKMLGTLVALSVARMRNLETFIWDMPTGILRDVWLALSSLGDRDDGQECRLERLWVRWHDNRFPIGNESSTSTTQPPAPLGNIPPPPNVAHTSGTATSHVPNAALSVHQTIPSLPALDRVEHPTFSVLPPLKSLSVLDIDELSYLDEMSILIGESKTRLRELRVGIAGHAQHQDWVTAWEGDVQQLDEQNSLGSRTSEKRLGGVLGILVGRVHDLRKKSNPVDRLAKPSGEGDQDSITSAGPSKPPTIDKEPTAPDASIATPLGETSAVPAVHPKPCDSEGHGEQQNAPCSVVENLLDDGTTTDSGPSIMTPESLSAGQKSNADPSPTGLSGDPTLVEALDDVPLKIEKSTKLSAKLQLEILELERVPLAVPVLHKAFDWSKLTSLTLLHCQNHEQLWKTLRRTFSPFAGSKGEEALGAKDLREGRGHSKSGPASSPNYVLNLKKIHTNAVSSSLIAFIKETLAPNSLEVLFLQEARSYNSNVAIDAIYRGALRRHRSSLRKLLIDSSEKGSNGHDTGSHRWKRWILNREILGYITSGRMSSLRELGVAIDYKDWHFFLQRLPQIPHLRSLYIPDVLDNVHTDADGSPKELALQIVDIVTLRPEIELCYMGIMKKCFEILENKRPDYDLRGDANALLGEGGPGGSVTIDMPSGVDGSASDEDDEDEDEDEDDDDLDGGLAGDGDETESDASEETPTDSEDEDSYSMVDDRTGPKLRLREILFYDDKRIRQSQSTGALKRTVRHLRIVQEAYLAPLDLIKSCLQRTQVTDVSRIEQYASRAQAKVLLDLQSLFDQALSPPRFYNTLTYAIYCGISQYASDHKAGAIQGTDLESFEQKYRDLAEILDGLHVVGLGGDKAQKAMVRALDRFLTHHMDSRDVAVDWLGKNPVIKPLRKWIEDCFGPFGRWAFLKLESEGNFSDTSEPRETQAIETQYWQEIAIGRLGTSRTLVLFEYVKRWDRSMGAIRDLKDYVSTAAGRFHITKIFIDQLRHRLLIPAVATSDILNIYISVIKVFIELDSKGVLLGRIARPIRAYLQQREDTVRIVVESCLADSNGDGDLTNTANQVCASIAMEMNNAVYTHIPEDHELDWADLDWVPEPLDAEPGYRTVKPDDVLSHLLTLFDREDLIKELQTILADHLLRSEDSEYEKEIRLIELLKARFGDDKLQACEVMLKDMQDSKRMSASINGSDQQAFTLPKFSTKFHTKIISSCFWPSLRQDDFRAPRDIKTLQNAYAERFESIKDNRRLDWLDAQGRVTVNLEFEDRNIREHNVLIYQATVIEAFQGTMGEVGGIPVTRTVEVLADVLEMDEPLLRSAIMFWVGKLVLREVAPDTFAVLERLDGAVGDVDVAIAAAYAAATGDTDMGAVKSQEDQFGENKEVYSQFVTMMLMNQGNKPTAQIHMMMKMMLPDGFPFSEEDLREFLNDLVDQGSLVKVGGDVFGIKR